MRRALKEGCGVSKLVVILHPCPEVAFGSSGRGIGPDAPVAVGMLTSAFGGIVSIRAPDFSDPR